MANIFATEFTTSHKNFSEMVPVLEAIINSQLKKYTLLYKIDRRRKKYWQIFLSQAESDIDYESKEIKKETEKIIDDFNLAGLASRDHYKRNFIIFNSSYLYNPLRNF